ncbi:hypothetical protein LIER_44121 [Lithospermum erythrorhizon]|uniref:Uncharacterized protein n=1 Tax=Lithospermum erythrorhizon TaxID=34254 RepID=A0AAV3Q191_LITER
MTSMTVMILDSWIIAGSLKNDYKYIRLQEEARGLPLPSSADIDSLGILRNALPQGENKLPWYTFCDGAMLVMAGLVYDKVFGSVDRGTPPSWGTNFICW